MGESPEIRASEKQFCGRTGRQQSPEQQLKSMNNATIDFRVDDEGLYKAFIPQCAWSI